MKSILIASPNEYDAGIIGSCFQETYQVDLTDGLEECLEKLRGKRSEFVFIDVDLLGHSMSVKDYGAALQPFWKLFPTARIIVMSPQDKIRKAVMAVQAGASNYLSYPIDREEVRLVTESLKETERLESELTYLRDQFWQSDSLEFVQTRSPLMQKVFDKVRSVAPTRTTVLLTGETGTGKGVLAKLIHRHGHRNQKQFISIHCGAIPDTLLESELFGHEKGSFTGAVRRKLGKFEIAHEGTIFLDEIGTVTPSAQIKLLRVLQDGSFQRVGGEEALSVDVRIIAATNSDLMAMSRSGDFRNDLYYRLSVFPIEVPPLRDRLEDIALLSQAFLEKLNRFYAKGIHSVHPHVMDALTRYSWPGNIRELENLMERAYILESSAVLTPESFPVDILVHEGPQAQILVDTDATLAEVRRHGIENIEKRYLSEVLSLHGGRIQKTADVAGITSRQLHKLMRKYGLKKENYKSGRSSRQQ